MTVDVYTDIEKEYVSRTKQSRSHDRNACCYFPGGSTRSATDSDPYPIYMKTGNGCMLTDYDGNEYIDFMNNYSTLILGHSHPSVNHAIMECVKDGIILGAPSREQYELAKIFCERVKSIDKIRFCNTGTEAVMYAIRTARAVTGRNKVVKVEGGFHGNTEQVEISVSPDIQQSGPAQRPRAQPNTQGITPGVLQDVIIIPFNNIKGTARIIEEKSKDIAAVIVEPLLGYSGMIPADREYLESLREITLQKNILLIFDEIISYRLSYGGAQEIYGIQPDLTTIGKIIGGGLPIGAFGGNDKYMEIYSPKRKKPLHHSGTFNGNRVTMNAGIAVMNEIDRNLISRINRLGEKLKRGMLELFNKKRIHGRVTGTGSLLNVHFSTRPVTDYRTSRTNWDSAAPIRRLLNLALKNRGIYTPQRVMFSISAPMTDREITRTVEAFYECLDQLHPLIKEYCPELLE
jgi:glutamate-1-semialdehyde 2,1-aminomutase